MKWNDPSSSKVYKFSLLLFLVMLLLLYWEILGKTGDAAFLRAIGLVLLFNVFKYTFAGRMCDMRVCSITRPFIIVGLETIKMTFLRWGKKMWGEVSVVDQIRPARTRTTVASTLASSAGSSFSKVFSRCFSRGNYLPCVPPSLQTIFKPPLM